MHDDLPIDGVERIVTETLQADFDNIRILDVAVHRDVDSDGDDVLLIDVLFEGTRRDVDARKLSGAVRHVRPKLQEIGETAFPLFSFVSRGDVGRTSFEPA